MNGQPWNKVGWSPRRSANCIGHSLSRKHAQTINQSLGLDWSIKEDEFDVVLLSLRSPHLIHAFWVRHGRLPVVSKEDVHYAGLLRRRYHFSRLPDDPGIIPTRNCKKVTRPRHSSYCADAGFVPNRSWTWPSQNYQSERALTRVLWFRHGTKLFSPPTYTSSSDKTGIVTVWVQPFFNVFGTICLSKSKLPFTQSLLRD